MICILVRGYIKKYIVKLNQALEKGKPKLKYTQKIDKHLISQPKFTETTSVKITENIRL